MSAGLSGSGRLESGILVFFDILVFDQNLDPPTHLHSVTKNVDTKDYNKL
jgi:hypothetical protein